MDLQDYKKAFAQAQADLERLTEEREEIDRKISKLKQAIIGLAPLADEKPLTLGELMGESPWASFGMTDMIREVLDSAEKKLTPIEIRDRLVQMKPDAADQVNLMASIHTVLKRLVPKEAFSETTKTGDVVYGRKVVRKYRMAEAFAKNRTVRDLQRELETAAPRVPGIHIDFGNTKKK